MGQSVLYHPGFIELFYPFTPYQHLMFPLNIDMLDIIHVDNGQIKPEIKEFVSEIRNVAFGEKAAGVFPIVDRSVE